MQKFLRGVSGNAESADERALALAALLQGGMNVDDPKINGALGQPECVGVVGLWKALKNGNKDFATQAAKAKNSKFGEKQDAASAYTDK